MIVLDAQSTRSALPMGDAIEAMEHAFSGESEAPLRSLVGKSLVMPGVLDGVIAWSLAALVIAKLVKPRGAM